MDIMQSERSQSVVIGSILLFAIVIAFLGMVQTFMIPDQIAAEEQNHANQIENEFTELYTVATSVEDQEDRSATLTLGMTYRSRAMFVTPPSASGVVQSGEPDTIESNVDKSDAVELRNVDSGDDIIADVCGFSEVETRNIQYHAQYSELRNTGQHTYETGVRYKSFSDSPTTIQEQQRLIDAGSGRNNINLMPLSNGSVSARGTNAESIAFKAGDTGVIEPFAITDNEAVTIEIPVHNPDAWERMFGDTEGDIDFDYSNDAVELTLNEGEYHLKCTPVGINERPNNSPQPPTPPTQQNINSPLNPIGDDDLIYQGTTEDLLSGDVRWEFENKDDEPKTVTDIRIIWTSEPSLRGDEIDLQFEKDSRGDAIRVTVGDDTYTPTGDWQWLGTETVDIIVPNGFPVLDDPTEFAVEMVFEDDDERARTYLIRAG